ncbi:MAG: dTDP-4-dehydrorhamnose 3,5-epimerase [Candidatus Zixiibacteriota bacterium]|nr:MAG: dTDP-4-dehydrorhamnose 3,5-epimerase [candidate division Zixibacteria bacterium]
MEVTKTPIEGLLIVKPDVYKDDRGYFFESYNEDRFVQNGVPMKFVQDNQSLSSYGVVRGLHYQLEPYAQTKLVRVLQGKILDVAVDIRKNSPTFGQWFGVELSDENFLQFLLPKGFAHGFSVLSKTALVMYKCDNYYNKSAERGIIYNDKSLNIDWKLSPEVVLVSTKDKMMTTFDKAEINF